MSGMSRHLPSLAYGVPIHPVRVMRIEHVLSRSPSERQALVITAPPLQAIHPGPARKWMDMKVLSLEHGVDLTKVPFAPSGK